MDLSMALRAYPIVLSGQFSYQGRDIGIFLERTRKVSLRFLNHHLEMPARPDHLGKTVLQALAFAIASSAAVCFPFVLSRLLWPEGLMARADHIFWPATAVNVAGLLWLGWRYAPLIFTGAVAAVVILGEPLKFSLIGATGNFLEALLVYGIIHRFGHFRGEFNSTRTVIALLLASLAAPFVCSLTAPAYLVYDTTFSPDQFWVAVGNWNLANSSAMLLLAPFLLAIRRPSFGSGRQLAEGIAWMLFVAIGAMVTFSAVFEARGLNFAFLIFPFVIVVAVRFGPRLTAAALALVMLIVYLAFIKESSRIHPEEAPAIIWFTQAFCWVLAATGLLVAALVSEKRSAEQQATDERARSLEISLREERARLEALRYQINPHFLFNALNSLRATFPLAAEVPREMITELSSYLRTTLVHSDADFAPLAEEVESVRSYLAIEKKRFQDDLTVSFSIEPSTEEIAIPVFLLQPLAENAIRHGFMASSRTLRLEINSRLNSELLTIEVANTGEWKPKDKQGRPSLGLENIQRRLALLYDTAASFHINAEQGWVRAVLNIPLIPPK